MDSYIHAAFQEVCNKSNAAKRAYCSLYVSVPFYGGPEEGGWWGEDIVLEEYQEYPSREQAENAKDQVKALADTLNKNAQRQYGENCARELEQADARGLDYDDLPEVDGPTRYFVVVEDELGSHERNDDRFYS